MTLSYDLEQLALEAFRMRASRNAEQQFAYPIDRVGVAKAWPSEANPEHVFVSIYEITDLRRLERVRQDFVSNVSHELRTPLTIIRSMTEPLLDHPVPDPELSAKYLPRIISEVDRLSMISNDLLILSAAESNPVRKSSCDIADVFRGVLDQLSSRAHEKGLEIKYTGPQHLEVEANPSQFTQVAINLIENAINYTNHGSVELKVAEEDGHAVVSVADTGLGIASEHQPRVFERFYRVDKARSRHSGGTGLGLSIVKHIVESHGGRVSVASTLNQGSTFTIRIPIGRPHAEGETLETS
jgi:two-component system phosphate regulon sensor histidine kinase PhoR